LAALTPPVDPPAAEVRPSFPLRNDLEDWVPAEWAPLRRPGRQTARTALIRAEGGRRRALILAGVTVGAILVAAVAANERLIAGAGLLGRSYLSLVSSYVDPPPAPTTAEAEPPTMLATPEPEGAGSAAPPDGPLSLFVHYAAGAEDGARRLARSMQQAGVSIAGVSAVPSRTGAGRVQYYFPDDRDAAAYVLAACAQLLGEQACPSGPEPPAALAAVERKPARGTIGIWLPAPPKVGNGRPLAAMATER
jgi:hypothetical protein